MRAAGGCGLLLPEANQQEITLGEKVLDGELAEDALKCLYEDPEYFSHCYIHIYSRSPAEWMYSIVARHAECLAHGGASGLDDSETSTAVEFQRQADLLRHIFGLFPSRRHPWTKSG